MRDGARSGAATRDAFLGGRLTIEQPAAGYRAGIEPVLLAASVPARPGERVLDLGCGAGVAALCLLVRVQGTQAVGVERGGAAAALARRNAAANRLALEVVEADVAALPAEARRIPFAHAIANPPFFAAGCGTPPPDPGRRAGRQAGLAPSVWLAAAAARTRPGGTVTMVLPVARLPEMLADVPCGLGALRVRPIAARPGRPPRLMLLRGIKGARAPFRLEPPMVLHPGPGHAADGGAFVPTIEAVLRGGASLDAFPRRIA